MRRFIWPSVALALVILYPLQKLAKLLEQRDDI